MLNIIAYERPELEVAEAQYETTNVYRMPSPVFDEEHDDSPLDDWGAGFSDPLCPRLTAEVKHVSAEWMGMLNALPLRERAWKWESRLF